MMLHRGQTRTKIHWMPYIHDVRVELVMLLKSTRRNTRYTRILNVFDMKHWRPLAFASRQKGYKSFHRRKLLPKKHMLLTAFMFYKGLFDIYIYILYMYATYCVCAHNTLISEHDFAAIYVSTENFCILVSPLPRQIRHRTNSYIDTRSTTHVCARWMMFLCRIENQMWVILHSKIQYIHTYIVINGSVIKLYLNKQPHWLLPISCPWLRYTLPMSF